MYQEQHQYRLTILYGRPKDPEAFDKYYHHHHIPLMRNLVSHGILKVTFSKKDANPDGSPPEYYLVACLYAENKKNLLEILSKPEGKALTEDMQHFATGGTTFLYGEERHMTSIDSGYHLF